MEQEIKYKIVDQSINEYHHSLKYRRQREPKWQLVDDFDFGRKRPSIITKANIHIPIVRGGIETFVSKIDDPPYIMYKPQRPQDQRAATFANASKDFDYNNNEWDVVDIAGKKQAAKYGRCIYKKYATNEGGFKDYFELVDVLDFYIDPMAGGHLPMDYAMYMGHDNIVKSLSEMQKNPNYDQQAVLDMAMILLNDSDDDNEYHSRQARRSVLGLSQAVMTSEESIKLTEHYTTYEGTRYKVLMSVDFKKAVMIQPLDEICTDAEWPFITWAVYPDPVIFWTPGIGELLLESNMVQNTLQSQMLDNITNRNYGMMAYDMQKVTNKKDLRFRPRGVVGVNGSPRDILDNITPPDITPAIQYASQYSQTMEAETGLNRNAKGAPNSKRMSATEFAGLIEQTADRFFLSNRTYKSAMKRFAKLYLNGLKKHLDKSRAIGLMGAGGGYEWVKMTKSDISTDANFSIIVKTGALAENEDRNLSEARLKYVSENRENKRVNQRMLDEVQAIESGFDTEDLPRLLNPELEGSWEIISEAQSENEELLKRDVDANLGATIGHVQSHYDFAMKTNGLTEKQRNRIMDHIKKELEYVARNEEANVRNLAQKQRQRRMMRVAQGDEEVGITDAQRVASPPPAMAALNAINQTQNPLIPNPAEATRQAAIASAPQPAANEMI